jgi:LytS/YehU family sensor histidine kinase
MHLRAYIGDAARRAIMDEQRENEEANDREIMSIVLSTMGVAGSVFVSNNNNSQQIFEVMESSEQGTSAATTTTSMIRITTFVYASSSSSR